MDGGGAHCDGETERKGFGVRTESLLILFMAPTQSGISATFCFFLSCPPPSSTFRKSNQ